MKLFNKLFTRSPELNIIQDAIYRLSIDINGLLLTNSRLVTVSLLDGIETTIQQQSSKGYIVVSKTTFADLLTVTLEPLTIKSNANTTVTLLIIPTT